MTVDQNLRNLAKHLKHEALSGECFWKASGLNETNDITAFYQKNQISQESLAHPSLGDYKLPHFNF
jgi:hypothetical protein